MQKKYLALAMSAMLATALTGCGSDNDSKYNASNPPIPEHPSGTGGSTDGQTGGSTDGQTGGSTDGQTGGSTDGQTGGSTDGQTGGSTDGQTGGSTDGQTGGSTDNTNPPTENDTEDNVGNAAIAGDQAKKSSVVGQQYVRGSSSQFDINNNKDSSNNSNATVVGFVNLQNDNMSNIVVAKLIDTKTQDAAGNNNNVDYILGAEPISTSISNADSLQNHNDAHVTSTAATWENGLITVTQKQTGSKLPEYEIANQDTKVSGLSLNITQTNNAPASNDVRIYGALHSTDGANETINSSRYLLTDSLGKDIDLTTNGKIENIKLNNVQYGRVTGNLERLKVDQITGQTYYMADLADKNYNGNVDQTDVYFYRGNNETALASMPTTGTYQYAGHALMYGINNSYNGHNLATTESNAPAISNSESQGVGNFVQATVKFEQGSGAVAGTVYNIWNIDNKNEQVDLVKFNGDIIGNSIKGTAQRTYVKDDAAAAFKGSFYGDNAQEMGGSFNSIVKEYGKAQWGGVFGASQLTKPKPVDPDTGTGTGTEPEYADVVNAIEVGAAAKGASKSN